jgi:hypothetical protein
LGKEETPSKQAQNEGMHYRKGDLRIFYLGGARGRPIKRSNSDIITKEIPTYLPATISVRQEAKEDAGYHIAKKHHLEADEENNALSRVFIRCSFTALG